MSRDQDKHKRIVRKRLAAIITSAVLLSALLFLLFIGIFTAVAALKKSTGIGTAAKEGTEESTEAAVEITAAGLAAPPDKEAEPQAEPLPGTDIEEQYEEAVKNDERTASALEIEDIIAGMSLEDKVSQLFFVRPEQLTMVDTVTKGGDATKAALEKYHVGGIIYFSKNLIDPDQTSALLKNTAEFAKENGGIPLFLAVDEEGGSVTRIASNPEFAVENTDTMEHIGSGADSDKAREAGSHIGHYLKELGFNVDLAPVADVKEGNAPSPGDRSFGSDPSLVSDMAGKYTEGLNSEGVIACYKHFPGLGRASANTDLEKVSIEVSTEELISNDLLPFTDAVKSGSEMMIMAGHASYPQITGDDTPASMSVMMITDYLRGELKYNGVVITDALEAQAVKNRYDSGEAAVNALKAGVDMLLLPGDFEGAYNAVLSAVQSGEIGEDRINASVSRILTLKSRIEGI